MKNSKEALEGAYNNALDLILNKKLKEGEKLLEKIYGSGNINIDIFDRYIPLAIGILFIIGILITIFMYKFSINKFLAKDL